MSRQANSGAIFRQDAQCVIASEQPYPAQGEILFHDLEGVVVPSNYASHAFQQVAAHVSTSDVSTNLRLATLSPDWSWKETAQYEWPVSGNLLVKHQCIPYCIGWGEEILAGCH